MNKLVSIINWCLAMVLCSFGVVMCTKAGFGLSMIGAPPYIIHVWLRDHLTWFSQGTGEYVWEAIILVVTVIAIRRFRVKYLLSFLVAVVLGFLIDAWLIILGGNGILDDIVLRIVFFIIGMVSASIAVALYFRTDMPLQVYELSVVEISDKFGFKQSMVKWCTDISYLVIAVILSLALTHGFTGIGIGTIVITVLNAPLIAMFGKVIDKIEKREQK